MRVILASKSPRRKSILSDLGVKFEVVTVDTDESSDFTTPKDYVMDIASKKGQAVADSVDDSNALVISADTVVVLDDIILGKPKSKADACEMLQNLQGKSHKVLTAVSLRFKSEELTDYMETTVKFGPMTRAEIAQYVDSGEPMDKAGSYAVQGLASVYIDGIDGCYFNVVGFPVRLFFTMLKKMGIDIESLK